MSRALPSPVKRSSPSGEPRGARHCILETLNADSREVLVDGDRLLIGFGALKNEAASTIVVALMQQFR
jgi:hypothetical protein